jgi:hypothetical protein
MSTKPSDSLRADCDLHSRKDNPTEPPVTSSLLFFLLLCGAFVASKSASSRPLYIPQISEDERVTAMRAASPVLVNNLLSDSSLIHTIQQSQGIGRAAFELALPGPPQPSRSQGRPPEPEMEAIVARSELIDRGIALLKDQQAATEKEWNRRHLHEQQAHCSSCGTANVNEWRLGPSGKRDLCESCGSHYAKLVAMNFL